LVTVRILSDVKGETGGLSYIGSSESSGRMKALTPLSGNNDKKMASRGKPFQSANYITERQSRSVL
ncbi:hypothetical protein, partial [Salmonella enterica]|uniref:hypothetical protein n=1 Tax=Salmonella enterica TaxID=28901 RepID=UPI001C37CCAF